MNRGYRFIIVFFILNFLFASGINGSGFQDSEEHNFFPMHVGNKWLSSYHFSGGVACHCYLKPIIIKERVLINDTIYHKINWDYNEYLWRYDKAENSLYFRENNSDILFVDFSFPVGVLFHHREPGSSITRAAKIIEDTLMIFDTLRYCRGYHSWDQDLRNKEILFVEDIGFVRLKGYYLGIGPDVYWREELLCSEIYEDTGYVNRSFFDSPWIEGNDIPDLYSGQFFADAIDIYSYESYFCSGGEFIDYIDSAIVEIFYSCDQYQISISEIPMNHLPQSTTWNYFFNLDPLFHQDGYSLNLRFKVWNKSYNDVAYYIPAEGWYKMKYEEPVGVDEENIPSEYSLSQNFPNPFNPSTTITYSLAEEALVQMEVFDILGNSVACLLNEKQTAGEYSVNFSGEGLSSGIYICKYSASFDESIKYHKAIKMIYLK